MISFLRGPVAKRQLQDGLTLQAPLSSSEVTSGARHLPHLPRG